MNEYDESLCRCLTYQDLSDLLLLCHNNGYFCGIIVCDTLSEYMALFDGLYNGEIEGVVGHSMDTDRFKIIFENSAELTVFRARSLLSFRQVRHCNAVLYTDGVPEEIIGYLRSRIVCYRQIHDLQQEQPEQNESDVLDEFLANFKINQNGEESQLV